MGKIVAGFGASHILFPPQGVEAQAERVVEGLLEIRRRVRELKPDVMILAGSDHLNTFNLAMQVGLAVGVADEFTTLGDMGLAPATFPGHRDFAEAFTRFAARRDYELVQIEEVRPDHGMAVPKLFIDPKNEIPTVPVYINAIMPVPPSPGRCYRLGGVLREMVETTRPADERVVVIGLGGLSHWLCMPPQGKVAEEFDRDFMARMIAGRSDELAKIGTEELLEASGNGGLELTAWLFMAGAMPPGAVGENLFYEAMPEWITGMGGLALTPKESVGA
jgi:aromatic ring-opening dioxygenase catalytic subunit (LigB family)